MVVESEVRGRNLQNIGNNPEKGWLPNPFGDEKITLRSYLNLFNFKANHRKTVVVDTDAGWTSKMEIEELPLSKLFVTILQRLGVETDSFGGYSGALSRV